VVSFLGIILVVNPALIGFPGLVNDNQINGGLLMKFCALFGGFCGASSTIYITFFGKTIHPAQNVLVFGFFVFLSSTLAMIFTEAPTNNLNVTGYNMVFIDNFKSVIVGICMVGFQICLAFACKLEKKTSNIAIIF
jgi:drug/metabolite transporter (DMT)-like permease